MPKYIRMKVSGNNTQIKRTTTAATKHRESSKILNFSIVNKNKNYSNNFHVCIVHQ